MASGCTAQIPQATTTASRPRCRTSSPVSAMLAVPASMVRIRPMASPQAVPVTLASSAAGAISSVMPGGCTNTKSRYGSWP